MPLVRRIEKRSWRDSGIVRVLGIPRSSGATLAAVTITLLVLFGCSGSGEETEAAANEGSPQTPSSSSADPGSTANEQHEELLPGYQKLREKWAGDLGGMVERGFIRALVVQSKTFYFLDGARQRGITYEAMREFETFLHKKLGRPKRKVHVVFIPVRRDELIASVANGTGDIAAANLTITPKRLQLVDFSDAGLRNVNEVVVTGPSGPQLSSIDSLAGNEVHVRPSSSYYESLLSLNDKFREAGKTQIDLQLADENLEDEDLLEMVNAGLIPAIVVDSHKAAFWAQVFDDITVHEDITVREGGTIAWAIRKNSPRLREAVNEFAKDHRAGTLFGNVLLRRYLRSTKWVKNPQTEQEMRKFRATADFFKKYALQYEFDWLLIMAQAYQESGLDQSRRSHVGAIGVMQLLPSTAAGEGLRPAVL